MTRLSTRPWIEDLISHSCSWIQIIIIFLLFFFFFFFFLIKNIWLCSSSGRWWPDACVKTWENTSLIPFLCIPCRRKLFFFQSNVENWPFNPIVSGRYEDRMGLFVPLFGRAKSSQMIHLITFTCHYKRKKINGFINEYYVIFFNQILMRMRKC